MLLQAQFPCIEQAADRLWLCLLQAMKLAAAVALVSLLLAVPSAAQYGYGGYGYGSYTVGRRLFSADSAFDSAFQQTTGSSPMFGRAAGGRSLLASYGSYSYGYGAGYGGRRRLLSSPSYGYGYGYGY